MIPGRKDLLLFAEAYFLLLFWKMVTGLFPLRFYARFLGTHQKENARESIEDYRIRPLEKAIVRAKRRIPFRIRCLAESIAAHRMLHHRNIPTTLYLGLARKNSHDIIAHAWLRCGEKILTGRRGSEKFTVVSFFCLPE